MRAGRVGSIIITTTGVTTRFAWWDLVMVRGTSVVLCNGSGAEGLAVLVVAAFETSFSTRIVFAAMNERISQGADFDARPWTLISSESGKAGEADEDLAR